MVPHVVGLLPPRSTRILEGPHQFLLLGVDADRGISLLLEAAPLPGNVPKLPITFWLVRPRQAFAVGPQRVRLVFQQTSHRDGTDRVSPLPQRFRQLADRFVRPPQTTDRITPGRILDQRPQLLYDLRIFFSKRGRPPPTSRIRFPNPAMPDRNSSIPRRMVVRLRPVITANVRMPP